ncbi:MAG: hypothetical protein Ta2G_05580 [Termitinemataceae bacterium]|nr:MAG: hypothetical protein Ta2G_05580 [Termitinemataceae bacterium]
MKKIKVMSVCAVILLVIACKSTPKTAKANAAADNAAQTAQANGENAGTDGLDSSNIKPTVENLGELLTAANEQRSEILANGFEKNDTSSFKIGEDALERASRAYNSSDGKGTSKVDPKAIQDASLALNSFRILLDSGWMAKIDTARKASAEAQQAALKLRADVAVKDNYNTAAEIHNRGAAAYRNRDWQNSYNFFVESKPLFDAAAISAAEKKRFAEMALKNAEKKLSESEKLAMDAEKLLEQGTEEVQL